MQQRRHNALRAQSQIFRTVLLLPRKIDFMGLKIQPLFLEEETNSAGRAGFPGMIKYEGHHIPLNCGARFW